MLGDSLLSQKEDSITADNYNTLEVPLKCDFRFTMSDGTKVWINAGSTLKYPAKFAADSRTVYASGEIYLEVAKDAERPFYVVVDGITVKVLGTSFNIRAYADENETKVTLLEGKIAAQINDKEYTLTPGKQLKCDKTFGRDCFLDQGVLHIQKSKAAGGGKYAEKLVWSQHCAEQWCQRHHLYGSSQQRRETGGFPPASGRGIQRKMQLQR